jgi:hypothetical protein
LLVLTGISRENQKKSPTFAAKRFAGHGDPITLNLGFERKLKEQV